jgi:hypothetical protein
MPPVTRSDFPYPLRTIDGSVKLDLNADDISFDTLVPNSNLQLDGTNKLISNGHVGTGSNVLQTNPTLVNPYTDDITVTNLNASSSVQTSIVKKLITVANTGTGNNVMQTAPTINSANLVTPSLGVATATDVTVNSLTASNAVQTDGLKKLVSIANTGSGNNVLNTNPQLVNPTLGTASATSINITSLAANSSVQTNGSSTLVTISNEGSGNNVLQTSPTLITPNIGAASGTSLSTTGNVESDQILVSNRLTGLGLVVNSTTQSTSSTTGCARFIGGVGIGGNVYAGGNIEAVGTVEGNDIKVNSFDPSSSRTTGAIKCNGGIGCRDIWADDSSQAFSKTNAVIKCQGGIGCNDLWVDDTSTANSKTSAAIKCQGGIGCEDLYVNTTARIPTITSLSTLNTLPFVYERGTFTPLMDTLQTDVTNTFVTKEPWDTPTVNYSEGYYSRIGDQVSISITTSVDIGGFQNDFVYRRRYPTISNLPFRAGIPGNLMPGQPPVFTCIAKQVSMPNGRIAGVPGIIPVNCYDDPYEAVLYPNNYSYAPEPPGALPAATLDGKTIIFEVVGKQYGVAAGVPPYNEIYSINQTLDNYNITFAGSYTLTFHLSMTYITDE